MFIKLLDLLQIHPNDIPRWFVSSLRLPMNPSTSFLRPPIFLTCRQAFPQLGRLSNFLSAFRNEIRQQRQGQKDKSEPTATTRFMDNRDLHRCRLRRGMPKQTGGTAVHGAPSIVPTLRSEAIDQLDSCMSFFARFLCRLVPFPILDAMTIATMMIATPRSSINSPLMPVILSIL